MHRNTFVSKRTAVRLFGAACAAAILAAGSAVRPTLEAQAINPIVTENSLAGSPQSEWDVQGAGDPTLQGFATDISVNKGSVVSFKIKTTAPGYTIDIYRLGYYQGFGARHIATVAPTAAEIAAATSQPACLTDAASGLVDCGNWAVAGSWNTTGVTSGIFIAKLTRSDNAAASSHIYFIVRDDTRAADVLFQTSDATWQAYNRYGGNSLYCGQPLDSSAGKYSCPARAGKVSYNRPFDTRVLDPQSFVFNAEYPMVRWLEANGYDVKYWTAVDTDRLGANLSIGLTSAVRPKAFFSVGHDEYWSADQRAHVEGARNAGVHLAFFSGNEMFWKTRYEPSIDSSATSYRTLVSYKETFGRGSRVDPNPAQPWTGTWRDPSFPAAGGDNPENSLIGQLWMVNCCSDRMKVPASMAAMRFWRNTAAAASPSTNTGGYRTPTETLGYEWDEVIDNGRLPAGLIRMSLTTLTAAERVTDYGINVAAGTATHSLTLYRHTSGALVFGAGTVQWSWGLDSQHDRTQGIPADQSMQQATVNLLADMGVQPRTLQTGADPARPLIAASMSADLTAPTTTIVAPAAGSSVESGARIAISGTVTENAGGIVSAVEVSVDNGATWRQASLSSGVWSYEWTPGSPGTANIRARGIDDSGNIESPGAGVTLTIIPGTCPCTSLWRTTTVPTVPSAADTNAVELGTKFYSDVAGYITGVRFYKSTANTGTHVGNLWSSTGTRLATVTFGSETASGWQQASFSTAVQITANTTYIISYHTNVGSYAADANYFATAPVDSPPLHAPTSPVANGNGVFAYGTSQFPTQTFNASNYWVDVVFATSLVDNTPPVISRIKSTIIDSARVTISWTTDEEATSKVQYSTDASILADSTVLPPDTRTVDVGTFVTLHSVVLTGLTPNTTYYYRVISADRSGNTTNVPAPSVTVPGPTLRDTASPDFAAGSGSATYTSETEDGEVILAPLSGTEFSGTTLSPGWLNVPYATGGAAFLGGGVVLVDGSRLGTCVTVNTTCQEQWNLTPGHRLEFVGTFTGDAFQHSGFAQDFASAAQPWAIFSTLNGGVLTARTNTGTSSVETFLGTGFLGFPHKYTIDWTSTSVVYSIDGTVVATHAVSVAGPMRPIAASDFSVFGGNVVIDWMRLGPYAAAGTFDSRVFDANSVVAWNTMQWLADTPAGTAIQMSVRTGGSPDPTDATWSAWQSIAAPGPLSVSGRYIQYRASLSSTDPKITPAVRDVIVTTGHAPTANPDSIVVPENGSLTLPASGPGSLVANDVDADNDPLQVVAVGAAAHGVVTLNFDGSVKYTPAANYSGPDQFVYTVSDGLLTASAVVTVDVRFGNIPPVANPDFYSLDEDTTLVVTAANGVLKNDTDFEMDPLTAQLASLPAHGVLALSSTGSLTYTPNPNYAGPDSFTYRAFDGKATSDPAVVTFDVRQVNDPPVGEADAYTAMVNQTLHVVAPGVLANDHDIEVEDTIPLHTQLVAGPAHGVLTLNSDGSFDYVPNADFLGLDQFTYAPVDHFNAVGNTTIVTITVALKSVSQAVNGGGTVSTGSDVTTGDPLASSVTSPTAATVRIAQGVIAGSQPPTGYTFLNQQVNISVLNPDGTEVTTTLQSPLRLAFLIDRTLLLPGETEQSMQLFRNGVAIPNCLGAAAIPSASLDPCITAREGGAALNNDVRVTILSSHASRWNMGASSAVVAPVAQNDGVYNVDYAATLAVSAPGVLGNDYGRNGLTAALVPGSELGGTVNLTPSGAFRFTPAAGGCGNASFRYTISDGTNSSSEATVSILIDCLPRAGNDTTTVLEDSGTSIVTVLANDSDPDPGQTLTIISVTSASHGLAAIATGGTTVSYTPQPDYFGADSFTYTISDGRGGTATATVSVTVLEVNDAPSFTKGANQSVNEDAAAQTIAAWATGASAGPANESSQTLDYLVTNDNAALFAAAPAISPAGTLTYTPAANANGLATVTVRLHDSGGTVNAGVDTSAPQTFTIAVAPINDAPSFVKGTDQSVAEDAGAQSVLAWATSISAGPADESAQAVDFLVSSDNAALFSVQPAIAANGTLTYTPVANANGSAIVTVRLHDNGGVLNGGVDTSAPQTFTITVSAVNDAPGFVKGADQSVLEDAGAQTVATWATAISAGPANESAQTLDFIVSNDNAGLFAVQPAVAANGTLTYTPAANANGTATVTVRLHDSGGVLNGGVDTSAAQTFTITLTAVNDAPSFVKGADQTVNEDAGAQSVLGWASSISAGPANESAQVLTFAVTNTANTLFAVQPAIASNGTLTYTPAANANGTATVTVRLTDNGGVLNGGVDTSAAVTFTITVNAVNDAPTFTKGADQALLEDAAAQTIVGWATGMSAGPSDESAQTLDFIVSNDNAGLFAVQPAVAANGTLTYTPAANANGTATVTVRLHDSGGVLNGGVDTSAAQTFTITLTAVNDAPSFVKGADQAVNEDAGAQSVLGWASSISAGPANESAQVLTFVVTNTASTLFAVQPAISSNGTLTYTPAANANGSATVTVQLRDDGGIANGGVDTSASQTFTITVASVNDAPSFVKGADQVWQVDAGAQTVASWATSLSAGPSDEAAQALNFIVTNNNAALFAVQPAIAANGTLTFTPTSVSGSAIVTVQIHDTGGVANGGVDTSAAQTFTITINPKPSLVISDWSGLEGNSGQTPAVFNVTLSAASPVTVTVQYATQAGTAAANRDYITTSGTLTFAPGETSKPVTVMVVGETTKEKNETFAVVLSAATNATIADSQAFGTIIDDDSTPRLAVSSASTPEGGTTTPKTTTSSVAPMTLQTQSTSLQSATFAGGGITDTVAVAAAPTNALVFAVAPTNANQEPMTVQYVTVAGPGVREGIDYTPVTGTITFPSESTDPVLISVPVIDDTRHEPNQMVFLHLLNPVEAVTDLDGVGEIRDDDPIPSVGISDVTVGTSSTGTINAVLTVTLSNDTSDVVTVSYSTADNSAVAGTDYVAASGVLTFQPGETSHVITLVINPSNYAALIKSFLVNLSAALNATMAKSQATVTVTPPTAWVSSTSGEFLSGVVGAGATVTETANGELTLKPAAGAEFFGTALPAGWTSTALMTGGSSTVGSGVATVEGAALVSATAVAPGRTLEFSGTFAPTGSQNVGFGSGTMAAPFAMFGVKADGTLYARSVTALQTIETPIAAGSIGAPHRFRIDWTSASVIYWIDGTKVATHLVAFGSTIALRPAIVDAAVGDGAVKVDWIRMTPYASSGTYTSPVYDAGASVAWQRMLYVSDLTSLISGVTIEVRTGDTAVPDASWTAFRATPLGGLIGTTGRYAQYRVTLTTTLTSSTPVIKEVALLYVK